MNLLCAYPVTTHKESRKTIKDIFNNKSFSDQCRHLEFPLEQVFQSKRLLNHLIRVHDPLMTDFCDALCFMEHNCVSYNLMKRSEAEGHRCELNNSTHEEKENDMEENPDYVYRGTKVLLIAQKKWLFLSYNCFNSCEPNSFIFFLTNCNGDIMIFTLSTLGSQ